MTKLHDRDIMEYGAEICEKEFNLDKVLQFSLKNVKSERVYDLQEEFVYQKNEDLDSGPILENNIIMVEKKMLFVCDR